MGPSQVTAKMKFCTNKNLSGPFYIGPVQTPKLCKRQIIIKLFKPIETAHYSSASYYEVHR